jgi:hypothetical protein
MSALVIWGEDDHQVRAKALASTYATTAQSIKTKPSKVGNLDSLVFWGHGDPSAFCSLNSTAFVDLVAEWKKQNPSLKTIEMLTCNARHKQFGYPDSYTEQVVMKLSKKHKDIKFKALPVAVTPSGNTADFSILKWHPGSATWAYVGAPGPDKNMFAACAKLEDFMMPRGTEAGYVRAHAALRGFTTLNATSAFAVKYKYDKARIDEYNKVVTTVKTDSYILSGTVGLLRWCLTEIN